MGSAIETVQDSCVDKQVSGNTVHDKYSQPYGKDIRVYQLKPDAQESCQFYVMKENVFIDHLRDIQKDRSKQVIWDREGEMVGVELGSWAPASPCPRRAGRRG